jgi:hypothetical protein
MESMRNEVEPAKGKKRNGMAADLFAGKKYRPEAAWSASGQYLFLANI